MESKRISNTNSIPFMAGIRSIGLEWLEELVTYSIATPFLLGERPVSILLISDVEAGKTELLRKFQNMPTCLSLSAFSRYGFLRDHLSKFKTKEKRTIIVPDLVQLIAGVSPKFQDTVITFLNMFVEEGITSISSGFLPEITLTEPLRANLVAAVPKMIFTDKRRYAKWSNMGFISRMLPVTYSYDKDTVAEIIKYLIRLSYKSDEAFSIQIPTQDRDMRMREDLGMRLNPLAAKVAEKIATYGFRLQRQLQTLCMARALINGRLEVSDEDVDVILRLATWCNIDFNPVNICSSVG